MSPSKVLIAVATLALVAQAVPIDHPLAPVSAAEAKDKDKGHGKGKHNGPPPWAGKPGGRPHHEERARSDDRDDAPSAEERAYREGFSDGRDYAYRLGDHLPRDRYRELPDDLYRDRYGRPLDDGYRYVETEDGTQMLIRLATGLVTQILSGTR